MTERRKPAPFELPYPLREQLRGDERAGLLHTTPRGTIFILKTPAADWGSVTRNTPVRLTHELYSKPTAPVVRTTLEWYDWQQTHLNFETFTDVADPDQRAKFARLSKQAGIPILAYDEQLLVPTKRYVIHRQHKDIDKILTTADKVRALIPDGEYDFDAAKARVQGQAALPRS
jgi:hypothetical protein